MLATAAKHTVLMKPCERAKYSIIIIRKESSQCITATILISYINFDYDQQVKFDEKTNHKCENIFAFKSCHFIIICII